jgi:hypothetical protein
MKTKCKHCSKSFDKSVAEINRSPNHFCNRSCSASYNGSKYPKRIAKEKPRCVDCGNTCKKNRCKPCYIKTISKTDQEKRLSRNKYFRDRRKNDISFRVTHNLRVRVNDFVKGKGKAARTIELIGCDVKYLLAHLSKQFTDGMSWDNYGEWEIDHIIPCSSYDLSNKDQQKVCFHYTNLQPLWKKDNLIKGSSQIS